MNHYIEYNEAALTNWMDTASIRYAARHGKGFNKYIEVTLTGKWKVYDHRDMVHEGTDAKEAIDIFNSITARG